MDSPNHGVAVVIPCYNAEATLARTIDSVLAQPGPAAEIIVVDDGSSDGSVAAAQAFGDRVTVLTGQNGGACMARNRGMRATSAEFVLFLDADDEIAGDHLGAGATIAEAAGADIVFTAMIQRNATRILEVRDALAEHLDCEYLFANWLLGIQVNPSAILWRRSFVERIGGWDERVKLQQDGDLVMRAFLNRARLAHNPRGYGIYYVQNNDSLSWSKSEAKERNYVETLARLVAMTEGTPFAAHRQSLEHALYRTARMAFLRGWPETGQAALDVLARMGPIRHRGTLRHRALASVLGLERKVRLWGA